MTSILTDLRGVGTAMVELLLPSRCAACSALVDPGVTFCPVCDVSVLSIVECCCRCGVPGTVQRCRNCVTWPPAFQWARGFVLYGGQVATAVARFKYGRRSYLARPLSRLMRPGGTERAALTKESRIVVPVPLHRRKLARRGFNQAALLARPLARRLGLDVGHGVLARKRDTDRQVGLSRDARQRNVAGAFEARVERVDGRHVLLVDDVMTTGATAQACSSVLLGAGARSVVVMTLARAVDPTAG